MIKKAHNQNMIDPDNLQPEPELLNKVLPSGGPLVAAYWTCPRCDRSVRGGPPPMCIHIPAREGCPVECGA